MAAAPVASTLGAGVAAPVTAALVASHTLAVTPVEGCLSKRFFKFLNRTFFVHFEGSIIENSIDAFT
jgi:hypothetical protein